MNAASAAICADPQRSNFDTAAAAAKEAAQAAFASLQKADTAVGDAGTAALVKAMEAGDAAIALEQFAPKRGKQKFLKDSTGAKLSSIKVCIKLAQGRDCIEKEMASASQMSIRRALRLLRPKERTKKPPRELRLNPDAWQIAIYPDKRKFIDDIGPENLWAALREDQKRKFYSLGSQEFTATRAPNGAQRNLVRDLNRDIGAIE